ncbi:MAG TPA: T9SS type A sorting domain-containing protein [Bacteroidetes bacterium]|nr:T9SS type A sorting domain-containing protein [Bacteroidota bacterium]
MRYFTFVFMLISFSAFSQLQYSYYPQVPYTDLSVLAATDNYIYAAGSCDIMMISNNSGESWDYIESIGSILDIEIVPGSNGKKAFMMLKDKIFLFDADTREFQKVSNDNLTLTAGYFRGLLVSDNSVFLISNGVVHKATVGEYTWTKIATFEIGSDFVRYSDMSENFIWVSTNKGKVIKMALSDNTTALVKDFNSNIRQFDMANDLIGYFAVSGKSYLQKTIDGGATFNSLTNMPESISPLAYGENVIMTVNTNRMYVSMDGGNTAKYVPMNQNGYTNLVSFSTMDANGVLYLAGKSGMVLKSEDFAESFENLTKYKRENLTEIEINTSGKGYALGGQSTVLYTEDNGVTWEEIDINLDEDDYMNSLVYIDGDKFLLGHSKGISVLENKMIVSSNPSSCDLLAKNEKEGYLLAVIQVNGQSAVSKSTDGGGTWMNLITLPEYASDLQISPEGRIFIPGAAGTIIVSDDGGDTWNIVDLANIEKRIQKIKFVNNNTGLLSTGKELYISKDGGKTASFLFNNYNISNLNVFSEKYFLVTSGSGNSTSVKVSKDQGENWTLLESYCFSTNNSFYDKDQTVWFAQDGGHINKVTIDKLSASNETETTSTFNTYPNPVVSGQQIKFNEDFQKSKLEIIDITTGKIVRRLTDLSKGYIDSNGLNTGTYLIKLNQDDTLRFSKLSIVN